MDKPDHPMILYRPVSLQELDLIYDGGMKGFPAGLPKQPIFYPVLQLNYARKTASKWNSKSGQSAGYVTQFKVEDAYMSRFETHAVGKSEFEEYWIPAEEVEEFNRHILGPIKILEAYFGDSFQGFIPDAHGLQGKNAVEQFTELTNSYIYKRMDFYLEIKRNHKAVFLNYPFWQRHDFKNPALKEKVIKAIREAWFTSFPKIPLANPIAEENLPTQQPTPPTTVESSPEETPPAKPEQSRPIARPAHTDMKHVPQSNPASAAESPSKPPPIKPERFGPAVRPVRPEPRRQPPPKPDSALPSSSRETSPAKPEQFRPITGPVRPDAKRLPRPNSEIPEKPLPEKITPPRQTNASHWVKPIHEDDPPVTQIAPGASVSDARPTPEQSSSGQWVEAPRERAESPVSADQHFVQGVKLGLNDQYQEAVAELSNAIERDPDHVTAQISLGVALHHLGEDDRALSCYDAALTIDSKAAEAHYFRANILYERGHVSEAVEEYTMAIGLKPELIATESEPTPQDRLTDYRTFPVELYRTTRLAQRILDLDRALDTEPRQPGALKERADVYSRLGNYEQAVADYSAALALNTDDVDALHFRGRTYEQLGQSEKAQRDYHRALAIDPQLAETYLERGTHLGRIGNLRQSIVSLTEGIRLDSQNPAGYFNRGISYFQLGEWEKAIEDFSAAIRLSPDEEDAYYWRGVSQEELGRVAEAISDYSHFLSISQNAPVREEVSQRLRQWKEEARERTGNRNVPPQKDHETQRGASEKSDQQFDLHALLVALGNRALESVWFGSEVECYGEQRDELYRLTKLNRPIPGRDLLAIAAGIRQTVAGDFQAFDPRASDPWIFIRAWNGAGFYIETNDPQVKQDLKSQLPALEEVEGATAPYESLFISLEE